MELYGNVVPPSSDFGFIGNGILLKCPFCLVEAQESP